MRRDRRQFVMSRLLFGYFGWLSPPGPSSRLERIRVSVFYGVEVCLSAHVRQIPWTAREPLPATLLAVSGTVKPTARKHRKAIISSVTKTHRCPPVFSAIAPPITGPIALMPLHVANIGPSIFPLSLTTVTSATMPYAIGGIALPPRLCMALKAISPA
jgi:hypothetical protein